MEYSQINWTKNHDAEKQFELINLMENADKQKPDAKAYLIHTACWKRIKGKGNKSKIRLIQLSREYIDDIGIEKTTELAIKCWKSADNKGDIDSQPLYLTEEEIKFVESVRQLKIDGFYLSEKERKMFQNSE